MENSFFEGISDGKKIEHHYETGFGSGQALGITIEIFGGTGGFADDLDVYGQCDSYGSTL